MKVTKETVIRTIVLLVALANQVLTSLGKNPLPFSDETVYEMVSLLVTVVAAMWAWWKNNSFTQHALRADELLKNLRRLSK